MKFQIELCTFSHPLCRGVAYRLGELLFFLPEEVFPNVLNRYVRKNVELGSDMAATLNGIYPRLTPSQTQNVMKHIHPYMTPDGCMEFRWEE